MPPKLRVNSVDAVDQSVLVPREVAVVSDNVELLRVTVNDPVTQAQALEQIIVTTEFPPLRRRMPLTLIRRVVSQCIISRLRPKLAFQPISDHDATRLDRLLARRIHEHLRGVFPFNSALLSLPLDLWGFDWPSVARLNRTVAVTGMLRDLNHHLPSFRNMAQITMADWTCSLNSCCFPLRPQLSAAAFMSTKSLPFLWRLAYNTLSLLDVSVRPTDVSFLHSGTVSLRHVHRMLSACEEQCISYRVITNLESAGLTVL
ncbi:hypothetical protein BDZ89DRAFT_952296, partial [Hymenopellis radicata]